ncbi:MAG TPA: hypothetical protein VFA26_12305 [Gemmataceae bacterium]|nr:hypothetical protein [Gemmataceae bacterium]
MRPLAPSLTLALLLGFTATAPAADGRPQLEMHDPGLPLWETRPLDRRVWVLTLDGKWNSAPVPHRAYYVNLLFPNGRSYSHRVDEDLKNHQQVRMEVLPGGRVEYRRVERSPFRLGDVQVVIPEHQLLRNGLGKGGTFKVVVSARRPVTRATAEEVVSNVVDVQWPMGRPTTGRPPRTRHQEPPPVDRFPLPGEGPDYETIPAPKPDEAE